MDNLKLHSIVCPRGDQRAILRSRFLFLPRGSQDITVLSGLVAGRDFRQPGAVPMGTWLFCIYKLTSECLARVEGNRG